MLVPEEKFSFSVYPEGNLNVCIYFNGSPPNSCGDILTTHVNIRIRYYTVDPLNTMNSQYTKCCASLFTRC